MFGRLAPVSVPVFNALRTGSFYVLAYHRVSAPLGPDYPFLNGMVSATPEDFDEQLRFVKERFNVINFQVFSDSLSSGERIPEKPLIITFDDGYADNYDVAFQLLKRHGLTATMYVTTGFIDSGQPLWFDRLAYIVNRMPVGSLVLESAGSRFDVNQGNRRQVIRDVRNLFLTLPDDDRVAMLNEIEEFTGVEVEPGHMELVRPLSWDQISEMSDGGIEIGSHTVTHPYLTRLTEDQLKRELVESKRVIERHTGRAAKSVAYPAGLYDRRVEACARDSGYHFGVSYVHGAGRLGIDDFFAIPRIHVETDVSIALFKANLLFPQLFAR